ncbi:uncharacterized protein LOC125315997 [Rhodamnia argentea]|uniref:uroporphyrinogen-III C-methyltransferase n=1 Tax=Rhodamnia argentea TaxID=178133 RepID=A0ABM3HPS6_9MYRT|nr:uncharacterized protein LOC125315997 [Rhodamnia argentea]
MKISARFVRVTSSSTELLPCSTLNLLPPLHPLLPSFAVHRETLAGEVPQRRVTLQRLPLPDSSLPPSSSSSGSDPDSLRRDDFALQLPELKNLLRVLKDKRERSCGCGGEKCGPGNVYLVGTGPGNPELLTLKAVRVIKGADLLLYDRLVSNDVLDLAGPDVRVLYVGKTAGYHSRTQEEIHELLLNFAEAGATIVRLKGGDPLVFGRGGEEMDFLQQQGIQVQVIPGKDELQSHASFRLDFIFFPTAEESIDYYNQNRCRYVKYFERVLTYFNGENQHGQSLNAILYSYNKRIVIIFAAVLLCDMEFCWQCSCVDAELINIGQKQGALQELHDLITSKRS